MKGKAKKALLGTVIAVAGAVAIGTASAYQAAMREFWSSFDQ